MAPKRTLPAAARPVAKRAAPADAVLAEARNARAPEPSAAEDMLSTATAVLDASRSMSESGREMLRRMLRGALGTAPAERHPYQAAVADMLRKAADTAEADLSGAIREADARVREAQAERLSREGSLAEARAALAEQGKALDKRKSDFCADNKALQEASIAFDAAARAKARDEGALLVREGLREALEAALKEHYPRLVEGAADVSKHLDSIMSLSGKLGLEDSLVSAFTVAARMPPDKRGAFDRAALGQLGPELERHAGRLAGPDGAAEAAAARSAAAAAAASAAMEEARARQRASAGSLRSAEIEQREAEGAEGAAEEAVEASQLLIGGAERGRKKVDRDLAAFRAGPLAALLALHGGCGPRPQAPGPAGGAPGAGERAPPPQQAIPTPARALAA